MVFTVGVRLSCRSASSRFRGRPCGRCWWGGGRGCVLRPPELQALCRDPETLAPCLRPSLVPRPAASHALLRAAACALRPRLLPAPKPVLCVQTARGYGCRLLQMPAFCSFADAGLKVKVFILCQRRNALSSALKLGCRTPRGHTLYLPIKQDL